MTDFLPWDGGSCPVPLYSVVNIRLRDPELCDDDTEFHANILEWEKQIEAPELDIVAYRLVVPQPKFIPWMGGENPAPGKMVEYRLRDSEEFYITQSENLDWSHIVCDSDIVSYRIHK